MAKTIAYNFLDKEVIYYLNTPIAELTKSIIPQKKIIVITDSNVFKKYTALLNSFIPIIIKPSEKSKQQKTVNFIINELIKHEATKDSFLIGFGGGVVTDITGYVASIYLRGVKFGLVPTSLLAMVDAAIGGKNGIDVGNYKNIIGTITQPEFVLYDYSLLNTLPKKEWGNGFAEIIKHSCIKDEKMFSALQKNNLSKYRKNEAALAELIEQNITIKSSIVEKDTNEKGERKLLNFGHTIGHAIENLYKLHHGQAISIGMVAAAKFSENLLGLNSIDTKKVVSLLQQYQLPTEFTFDKEKVWQVLKMDKKRNNDEINFILLNKIGEAVVKKISLDNLQTLIQQSL